MIKLELEVDKKVTRKELMWGCHELRLSSFYTGRSWSYNTKEEYVAQGVMWFFWLGGVKVETIVETYL